MSKRFHCLMVGLRPSDLVEIAALAGALALRGHRVTLLYLYAGTETESHRDAFASIDRLARDGAPGLRVLQLDLLAIHRGAFERAEPISRVIDQIRSGAINIAVQDPSPAAGITAKVVRRLRDPLGTAKLLMNIAPAFTALVWRLPPRMWRQALTAARRTQDAILVYSRFHAYFTRAIAEWAIDVAVIPEDIVGPIWPVLISAAHASGVPVLVCPYTLANQLEAIQSLKAEPGFQTSANAIGAYLHPVWRFNRGAIDIVRLPTEHILAHHALRITPPDPWMMNSGYADRLLVDSQASFDYFGSGGIPEERMTITGSASQDIMFERRKARTSGAEHVATHSQYGRKPMLLLSGCPNQLSARVPRCEFDTMEALAAYVGESVAPLAAHYQLVVRPHPNYLEFAEMLMPFGFTSTVEPTASLVPLADVFVAFASATIRWAVACGIPTINYDVFHYGYADFASAKSVVTMTDGAAFRSTVRSLVPGSPQLTALAHEAWTDAAHWGVMDGQGTVRIEKEIYAAVERRNMLREQHRNA